MCERRCAGKENERSQPGWSHLYGLSLSRLTPRSSSNWSSAEVGVRAPVVSPAPSIFVCIPLTPGVPRYSSVEGGATQTGLSKVVILLSIEGAAAACMGLIGERPTATEIMEGESCEEGEAFVEWSREGGAVMMCGEEVMCEEVPGRGGAEGEEVMTEEG